MVRTQLQGELLRPQQELSKTIAFVTHDIDEAVRLGGRIAVFRTGDHLVQCAPPAELLARPADERHRLAPLRPPSSSPARPRRGTG
ncbi:hypothetical protein AQI95_12470 [Streptomyces yokosukanensis]|uniref:ABC transporter ATP-binding protein n=1 Tax=Streptomyces yokosukanensis TaxID=67386 RepID=A0A101P858_9ACTN|nr:hypothetical protein AQI95_12470 [Streptomyces yokosukanensis]